MTKSVLTIALLFVLASCSSSRGVSIDGGGGDAGDTGKMGTGGAIDAGEQGTGGGSGAASGGSSGIGGIAGQGGTQTGGGGSTVASGGAGGSRAASGGAGGFTTASGGAGGSAVVHDRCADPRRVDFVNGRITISDDTSRASDEFPALSCGGGHFVAGLRGRQLYYRFTVRAGLKYELRLQSLNRNYDPDIFYVFPAASVCSVDAIQAACMSNGVSGTTPTTPNVGGLIPFVPRDPGDYIVAVDTDFPGAGGPFTLDIFEFCGVASPTACKIEACPPSLTGTCNQNVLTICADGTGTVMNDCAVGGSTCFKGACQPTVVDFIGSLGRMIAPMAVAASTGTFNFYAVSTNRTLTQINQLGYQGSAIPVTWVVFEATTQAGPYGMILSKNAISNSAASGAAESSGPISVPLVAGRFYAIGVVLPVGASYDVGQELTSPLLPEATFFGQLISAKTLPGSPPWPNITYAAPSTFAFPQRLTTAL